MTNPLIQTGPGGDYTQSYMSYGARLLAVRGAVRGGDASFVAVSGGAHARGREDADAGRSRERARTRRSPRLLDRLLGIDRVELSPEAITADEDARRNHDTDPAAAPAGTPTGARASFDHNHNHIRAAARSWLSGQRQILEHLGRQAEQIARQIAGAPRRVSRSRNSLRAESRTGSRVA